MHPIMERSKSVRETGIWWLLPWWRDEQDYKDNIASRAEIDTAFSELIKTFDAKWLLNQKTDGNIPLEHLIASHLVAGGKMPFKFLYDIGINLHTVRLANLLGDIERRLKSQKEYLEGVLLELKFLARFIRAGYKIEPHYPSGIGRHNCDFKISRETETVYLEIKRPWQLSAHNRKIISEIYSNFIPRLLTDSINNDSDFTSSPLSSRSEADKVFRIVRDAANNQIPKNGPGIVAVASPFALNRTEFEIIADKRFQGQKKYPSLSAVVLIESSFHENQISHNSHFTYNRQANIDIKSWPLISFFHNLDVS